MTSNPAIHGIAVDHGAGPFVVVVAAQALAGGGVAAASGAAGDITFALSRSGAALAFLGFGLCLGLTRFALALDGLLIPAAGEEA